MENKMLVELNVDNFVAQIEGNGKVLVDLYADWCGPCKMLAPIIEEIANEQTEILVAKVNVDDSPAVAIMYDVKNIPTLIAFVNGEEKGRIIGVKSKEEILNLFK